MPSGGEHYFRLMSEQSRRAHAFDRTIRWFWMRWLLTGHSTAEIRPTAAREGPPRQG